MQKIEIAMGALLLLVIAGCKVGPSYQHPQMALPAQFTAPATDQVASQQGSADEQEFWQSFHDAELTHLVELSLQQNRDLRVGLAHYDAASSLLRLSKLDRTPTMTMSGQVGRQRLTAEQAAGGPRNNRFTTVTTNASWELDFYGRVRHEVEAQQQLLGASSSDLAALQVAIAGEVATTYMDLRGEQERLRVAEQDVEKQKRVVDVVEASYTAGRATAQDTARAWASLESSKARIPVLRAEIMLDGQRLAVLCGQTPGSLAAELAEPKPLPDLPANITAGTPTELVRRRPDIRAAEQRLHAATEQIGINTAALYPQVSFGGLLGLMQYHADTPLDGLSAANLVGLQVDWSFLDRGRVKARIAASRADGDAQLAAYQQTVLLALEDVEGALVRYDQARAQDGELAKAAADSRRAAELARVRYQEGATSVLDVLDAERAELDADDAYAASRMRSATGAVGLYKSLAGGWPQRQVAR